MSADRVLTSLYQMQFEVFARIDEIEKGFTFEEVAADSLLLGRYERNIQRYFAIRTDIEALRKQL